MVDVVARSVRSRMMSGIRGQNTRPELVVRRRLHGEGFRFRLYDKTLPGKPDLALRKWRTVVLVHGCFWHGHRGCRYFREPATRPDFWKDKIRKSVERDRRNMDRLLAQDWRVAVVWECALRDEQEVALARLVTFLRGNDRLLEIESELTRH